MSNPIEFPPYPRDPESIRGRAYAAQVLREAADAIEGVWEGIEESGQPYTPAMAAGQLRARAADLESPNCFSCMAPHSKRYPAEPVGVSDEAVAKALRVYLADQREGAEREDAMRAALEVAAPLLGTRPRPTLPPNIEIQARLSDYIDDGNVSLAAAVVEDLLTEAGVRPLPTREQIEQVVTDKLIASDALAVPGFSARIEGDADDIAEAIASAVLALMGGAE